MPAKSLASNLDSNENTSDIIRDIQKNASQRIRVSRSFFKGHELIDLRLWVIDESGEYRPTKQGVSIRQELLGSVIDGLSSASEIISGGARHD